MTILSILDAGASVEIYCDCERNLKGIFFQDQQMKDAFKAYPELLCLDATYKLLELGLPVYLMLCEDSNGQSEVVAVCLLVTEDGDSMTWMMEALKKHNVDWEGVRVVVMEQVLKRKQKKMTWVCNIRHQDLHAKTSGPSIICESCLLWFHFACVGLSKQPKTKNWFCRSCYAASK